MKRITLLLSCVLFAACSRSAPPAVQPAAQPAVAAASAPMSGGAPASGSTTPAARASVPPREEAATETLAHWDGYGDLRFGMAPAAARTAWGGDLAGDATDVLAQCGYLHPTWARPRSAIGFMFENGRLVRYDVDTPKESAPGGGRIGMSRARIEALYPGAEARPHQYVQGAWYLRVRDPGARDRALVFETDARGTVTRWRVGVAPPVDYIEGCS